MIVWTSRKMLLSSSGLFGILLQPDQLGIEQVQAFDCLGQELLQKIVHVTCFLPDRLGERLGYKRCRVGDNGLSFDNRSGWLKIGK